MGVFLHLAAERPCVSGNAEHIGYAYYIDEDGQLRVDELDPEQAAGRNVRRLVAEAERQIGRKVLSALAVVRMCNDHEQPRPEFAAAAVIGYPANDSRRAEDLSYDPETGLGVYEGSPLAVLPFVPEGPRLDIIPAATTPGSGRLFVAKQIGSLFAPNYLSS